MVFNQFNNNFQNRATHPQVLSWNLTKFWFQASSYYSENQTPASVCIKFILYNQKWRKLPLRISSESSFFSRQRRLLTLVDMALHLPQRHQSRFPFHSFSASFVCIAEELTSPSVFSLSLTVGSKLYYREVKNFFSCS